jgi:hypothetical protein
MSRVLVVGGGPAGLAAAEALLQQGRGRIEVTLLTLGHHLGGKAVSWTDDAGFVVEHGQRVMLGFYDALRGLLRRAGVDPHATSVSNEGNFVIYEDRDGGSHHLRLGRSSTGTLLRGMRYTGWTGKEKAGFAATFIKALPEVVTGVPEALDDLCLTAWCLARGFPISAMQTHAFRLSREAQLNWPGEISAYAMLKAIRAAGRDYQTSEGRLPAGGMSDIWWEPIAAHIGRLGGQIVRCRKLVGLEHARGLLTGLRFASPRPHARGVRYVDGSIPTVEGSEQALTGFDAAILTVPPPALWEAVRDDPVLAALRPFANLQHLTTVAPLGLHVWHRNRVTIHRGPIVGGLEAPLGFVVDNKPIYAAYRDDPRIGAALHFVARRRALSTTTTPPSWSAPCARSARSRGTRAWTSTL